MFDGPKEGSPEIAIRLMNPLSQQHLSLAFVMTSFWYAHRVRNWSSWVHWAASRVQYSSAPAVVNLVRRASDVNAWTIWTGRLKNVPVARWVDLLVSEQIFWFYV
jgi:hypothetical protein